MVQGNPVMTVINYYPRTSSGEKSSDVIGGTFPGLTNDSPTAHERGDLMIILSVYLRLLNSV